MFLMIVVATKMCEMIEYEKKLKVSRHNYQVELTVINVTKADEENVHSLKITKRYLSMMIMLPLKHLRFNLMTIHPKGGFSQFY